jgi:hypothetical protein
MTATSLKRFSWFVNSLLACRQGARCPGYLTWNDLIRNAVNHFKIFQVPWWSRWWLVTCRSQSLGTWWGNRTLTPDPTHTPLEWYTATRKLRWYSKIAPVRLEERRSFSTAYKMSFMQCVLDYILGCTSDITIIFQYSTLLKSSVMQ